MYRFLEYTVRNYMTAPIVAVTSATTMRELDRLFRAQDFNSFPVVDDGRFVGLVTKLDFLKTFAFSTDRMVPPYEVLMSRTVADAMTRDVISVTPTMPLTRVLELMVAHKLRSVPVTEENGDLAGIISREDIMRALDDATSG